VSNWICIEELDRAVIDWAQKFEDRVVMPLLDSNWASLPAKHRAHWLFIELRDAACEGDGKEVKRLATIIFDLHAQEVARFHARRDEQCAQDLLRKALNGGSEVHDG